MSDQDIFDDNNKPVSGEPVASGDNPFDDLLKGITNDAGEQKYNSIEDALKALEHSQAHIRKLEQEAADAKRQNAQTAEELSKMKTIDEFVDSLKTNTNDPSPQATPDGVDKGVKPEEIEALLEKKLADRASKESRQKNLTSVVEEISKTYGDKASEHIRNVATEMGTTAAKLKELAEENPKLALSILGPKSPAPNGSPIQPTSRSNPNPSDDNPVPTWEKGAARGGLTNKELVERWKQVGSYTHKRLGVTE